MKISCGRCKSSFNIPDRKLPMGKKVSFPCPKCKEKIKLDLSIREPESQENAEPQNQTLDGEALKEEILRTLKSLPAMPQVVLKAREIIADVNSGIKDVVKVLETDQAITTKILKISNSAYYGMSGKISTIQHASVVLGYKTIGELITLAASSSLLNKDLIGYGMSSDELWKHSLSVAIGSRILAEKKNPNLVDTSFSAGLIHDAGKLILDKYVQERKEDFDEIMEYGQITFMEAEKKIFGFNHAEIGFNVCKHWKIPEDITIAINHHHSPSRSGNNELAYIIYMADSIVNMSNTISKMESMGSNIDAYMFMLDDKAMDFIGISEADVKLIIDQIYQKVSEMAGGV